jgi:hypothetical protein
LPVTAALRLVGDKIVAMLQGGARSPAGCF